MLVPLDHTASTAYDIEISDDAGNGADGEKVVDVAEFAVKVKRVLNEPSYHRVTERVAESMPHFGGAQAAAKRMEERVLARRRFPTREPQGAHVVSLPAVRSRKFGYAPVG